LGFCASFGAGYAIAAFGQTVTLSDAWAAYLRPGCHVTLVLPNTQLEVQTKWLGPITVSRLAGLYRGVCPSNPVEVNGVEFGRAVLDVLKIQSGLGRDFLRVFADVDRAADNRRASPQRPSSDQIPTIEASIEMRNDKELD
jgi:hypothetical protein